MTKSEGVQARAYLQRQELMQTPAGKVAIESAMRTKRREIDKDVLKQFEPGYIAQPEVFERKKTDDEIMMEEILKNYR